MVLTNFTGNGVGFGFGIGCGFGVGWGFGVWQEYLRRSSLVSPLEVDPKGIYGYGMPLHAFGLGIGGGCGVGLGLGWGFGSAFGCQYRNSKVRFHGIEFDSKVNNEKLGQDVHASK